MSTVRRSSLFASTFCATAPSCVRTGNIRFHTFIFAIAATPPFSKGFVPRNPSPRHMPWTLVEKRQKAHGLRAALSVHQHTMPASQINGLVIAVRDFPANINRGIALHHPEAASALFLRQAEVLRCRQ